MVFSEAPKRTVTGFACTIIDLIVENPSMSVQQKRLDTTMC